MAETNKNIIMERRCFSLNPINYAKGEVKRCKDLIWVELYLGLRINNNKHLSVDIYFKHDNQTMPLLSFTHKDAKTVEASYEYAYIFAYLVDTVEDMIAHLYLTGPVGNTKIIVDSVQSVLKNYGPYSTIKSIERLRKVLPE